MTDGWTKSPKNDERRSRAEAAIYIDHEREQLHAPSRHGTQLLWCTLFPLMLHAEQLLVSQRQRHPADDLDPHASIGRAPWP